MNQEENQILENIDYNVYNALNLVDEQLGKDYVENGYNPFDDTFVLTNDYIQKTIENSRDDSPILTESFLERPIKEVKQTFTLALENTTKLKDLLQNNINDNIFDKNVEKQVKEVVVFLKNREKMLSKAIANLNLKNPNPLKDYQKTTAINKKLSQLLKESYYEEFKLETAHLNFVRHCQSKAKLEQLKQLQRKQKIQEQTTLKQQQKQQDKKQEALKQQTLNQTPKTQIQKTLPQKPERELE